MSEGPSAALGERRGRRLLGQSESAPGGGALPRGRSRADGVGPPRPGSAAFRRRKWARLGQWGRCRVRAHLCIFAQVLLVPGSLGSYLAQLCFKISSFSQV